MDSFKLIGSKRLVTATINVKAPRKSMRWTRSIQVISRTAGGSGMLTFQTQTPMQATMIGTCIPGVQDTDERYFP